MYWRTPDVGHITVERIFNKDHKDGCVYDFIHNNIGVKYDDLKYRAIKFFDKEKNPKYFGQIISYINFLGLLSCNEKDEIVEKNNMLEKIYYEYQNGNKELAKKYMDYYLCKWQFPAPNIKENRNDIISKPFLIILKILLMLREVNENESYLTTFDFCRLFNKPSIKKVDDINKNFIEDIIVNRNKETVEKDKVVRLTSYYTALLKNSSVLTYKAEDYDRPNNFMIGLDKSEWTVTVCEYFINKYSNVVFKFNSDLSHKDKRVLREWSYYINNESDFSVWRREVMLIEDVKKFKKYCLESGYYYDEDMIRRFIISLEAKQFLILTGISGSGKTKIAELWGEYKKNYLLISVGSNWNDNKKLLGYKNLLVSEDESYIKTSVVELIEKANNDIENEYILILDEMNLSHVERYFSDFLSAFESISKEIELPSGKRVCISKNIKIIGTVNIDETTYMFSPKVLDRANVIEINGSQPSEFINKMIICKKKIFLEIENKIWFNQYKEILDEIYIALNRNFGYRVIEEITTYININTNLYSDEIFVKCFDEQIYQKILPKIHGTKAVVVQRLQNLKSALGIGFILTNTKIDQMIKEAQKGYTSFIGE